MKKKKARKGDVVQVSHSVMQDIIRKTEAAQTEPPAKNPAAVALGRMGGLKGGKARAASLTGAKRREIARKAARERWRNRE